MLFRSRTFLFPEGALTDYWLPVAACVFGVVSAFAGLRVVSRYVVALAVAGAVKLLFAVAVNDYELISWHNAPGIQMLIGAFMVLVLEQPSSCRRTPLAAGGAAVTLLGLFLLAQPACALMNYRDSAAREVAHRPVRAALLELQARVVPSMVTAIPMYTAIEWVDGYRFAFFPRGVLKSPVGIAEYAIVERSNQNYVNRLQYEAPGENGEEHPPLIPGYDLVDQNAHFMLFRRNQSAFKRDRRAQFISHCGAAALGLPEPES